MEEPRDVVLHRPIGRALFTLAWPLAVSNQLETLTIGAVVFWLGRLLGDSALTVESLFRPVGLMSAWLLTTASTGSSMLVARSVGARDGRGYDIVKNAIMLTLIIWAVVAAIVLPMSGVIASALAGELPLENAMLAFLFFAVVAQLPAQSIAEVLLDVASATGWTKLGLARVLVNLAVGSALMPLFIDAFGMGAEAAPLAFGITSVLLAFALWSVLRRRSDLELGSPSNGWRPDFNLWREILAIGMPVHLTRMVMFGIQVGLLQIVAREGGAAAAGFGIAGVVLFFVAMTSLALAQATATVVGSSLGAQLPERAASAVRAALLGIAILTAVFFAITLVGESVIRLFTSSDAIVHEAMRTLSIMRWGVFATLLWQILLASFSASKKTVRASALLICADLIGAIIALTWPGDSPLTGVAVAFCVASGLKALALVVLAIIVKLPGFGSLETPSA